MKVFGYWIRAAAALACIILLAACGNRAAQIMTKIGLMPSREITEVTLAVPVPLVLAEENTGFIKGVELACEDIAAMEMPVTLNVQIDDDESDFGTAVELAWKYINDPSVIGVVGHWNPDICVSVSSIYAAAEQTLIVPSVSISSLTSPPSDYIFRNTPADDQISTKMCDYAKKHGTKKAVIYYEDSTYGFEMSAGLEKYADSIGIEIVDRVCAPNPDRELPQLKRKWEALDYDTVFVVSNANADSLNFINLIRASSFEGSVICDDRLGSISIAGYLKPGNGNLVVSSTYNDERAPEGIKQFQKRYSERYGTQPDSTAAQGYDCVMIVAEAVANHNVRTSGQLSEYLRSADSLGSIFGETSFDERHEIIGKPVFLKKYNGNQFDFIY